MDEEESHGFLSFLKAFKEEEPKLLLKYSNTSLLCYSTTLQKLFIFKVQI